MFTFPKTVKIMQKQVNVYASPRGYVKVGETIIDLTDKEKFTSGLNDDLWNQYMENLFKKAVKKERERMKK